MRKSSTYRSVQDRVKCGQFGGALLRDGHGRLVLLVHRANADPEEDGGGHHRRKREREGVVHEVELASSHREHHGFRRVVEGLLLLFFRGASIVNLRSRCEKTGENLTKHGSSSVGEEGDPQLVQFSSVQ